VILFLFSPRALTSFCHLVDRLQHLVDVLVSTNPHPDSLGLPVPPPSYPSTSQGSPAFFTPTLPAASPPASYRPALSHLRQLPEDAKDDVESHDLVRRLSELTIKTFQLGGIPPAEYPQGDSLVQEVTLSSPFLLALLLAFLNLFLPCS
jgi:hypothetical protein